ncbi:MAG: hypothetical protein Q4C54_09950 [Clostridia bacterium]|nr:hypothetical protein [Clostridia bacterium]
MAGRIYAWMETTNHPLVCSLMIFRECLGHPNEEPKNYQTREISEIVNKAIESGRLQGWRKFPNSRRFANYGTQRGWEKIPGYKNNCPIADHYDDDDDFLS